MANIRVVRRSGRILRGGSMVRETLWGDVTGTFTNFSGPATVVLLNVTGTVLLNVRPWTVVRARGFWHIQSDQSAAAELQSASVGMAIVSDQAVAIGVSAVPTPITDMGSDAWFMYETLMSSTGAGDTDQIKGIGSTFDSRAMRKVEDGFQLVVVGEADAAALSDGLDLRFRARILIKLH